MRDPRLVDIRGLAELALGQAALGAQLAENVS